MQIALQVAHHQVVPQDGGGCEESVAELFLFPAPCPIGGLGGPDVVVGVGHVEVAGIRRQTRVGGQGAPPEDVPGGQVHRGEVAVIGAHIDGGPNDDGGGVDVGDTLQFAAPAGEGHGDLPDRGPSGEVELRQLAAGQTHQGGTIGDHRGAAAAQGQDRGLVGVAPALVAGGRLQAVDVVVQGMHHHQVAVEARYREDLALHIGGPVLAAVSGGQGDHQTVVGAKDQDTPVAVGPGAEGKVRLALPLDPAIGAAHGGHGAVGIGDEQPVPAQGPAPVPIGACGCRCRPWWSRGSGPRPRSRPGPAWPGASGPFRRRARGYSCTRRAPGHRAGRPTGCVWRGPGCGGLDRSWDSSGSEVHGGAWIQDRRRGQPAAGRLSSFRRSNWDMLAPAAMARS